VNQWIYHRKSSIGRQSFDTQELFIRLSCHDFGTDSTIYPSSHTAKNRTMTISINGQLQTENINSKREKKKNKSRQHPRYLLAPRKVNDGLSLAKIDYPSAPITT
jgi:hypothetical protein